MDQKPIVVDAMGGDNAPVAIVEGAVVAARHGIAVTLVGAEERLRRELQRHQPAPANLRVVNAAEVIAMDEHPSASLRRKRDSSVAVGLQLVKSGKGAAFISAGNSGATMALATLTLGRLPGIDRPALGTVFPSVRGRFLLLDVGANADARPAYLEQFALLGKGYAEGALRIREPRIALLNIGEEDGKGSEFAREVHGRLKALPGINFVGNIDGKDLTRHVADVVVTDGFTGNVAIKTAEGVAEYILGELRTALTSKLHYKLAALVLRPAFMGLRGRIDYAEYGGAPLLGLNGLALISHGRSNARAIAVAIRVAREAADADITSAVAASLQLSSRAAGNGDAS
ncbi:MAG: phosphate acyltransferase PlsX [Dehalococcoidia bacterium]